MLIRRRTRRRFDRARKRVHDLIVNVLAAGWIARRFWRHGRPRRAAR